MCTGRFRMCTECLKRNLTCDEHVMKNKVTTKSFFHTVLQLLQVKY